MTSAGYGHTVGKTIAFGYVPAGLASEPGFDLVAFGDTWRAARGARVALRSEERAAEGMMAGENAMNMHDDTVTIRQLIDRLALFPGASPDAISINRLGGQTNRVYRVGNGRDVLCLRLPGKGTEEYINRRVEMVAAEATAKAGVSPEVVHFDPATGVMVTRFLDHAVTMSPALFAARPGAPERAGRTFRTLHRQRRGLRFPLRAVLDDRRLSRHPRGQDRRPSRRATTRASRRPRSCAPRSPRIRSR